MNEKRRYYLGDEWYELLKDEFEKPYMKELAVFLAQRRKEVEVYPPENIEIFNAYRLTPYSKIKVVIIGQDVYHTPGTAHGLCFSTKQDKIPPSLQNIFKEIYDDLNISCTSNDLTSWARQGVFLLNTILTVEKGSALSHSDYSLLKKGLPAGGWQIFTKRTLELLNQNDNRLVFMLWGSYAKKFREYLTNPKHLILESAHPSPFSAYNGFFGCKHFSKTNRFLRNQFLSEIDWCTK